MSFAARRALSGSRRWSTRAPRRRRCRACGEAGATRVYSAPSAPFGIVKPPGEARRQERRNADLRARTKADFKARRRRDARRMSAPADDRRERLIELYREVSGCTRCPLHAERTKVVFGAGNADAG